MLNTITYLSERIAAYVEGGKAALDVYPGEQYRPDQVHPVMRAHGIDVVQNLYKWAESVSPGIYTAFVRRDRGSLKNAERIVFKIQNNNPLRPDQIQAQSLNGIDPGNIEQLRATIADDIRRSILQEQKEKELQDLKEQIERNNEAKNRVADLLETVAFRLLDRWGMLNEFTKPAAMQGVKYKTMPENQNNAPIEENDVELFEAFAALHEMLGRDQIIKLVQKLANDASMQAMVKQYAQ